VPRLVVAAGSALLIVAGVVASPDPAAAGLPKPAPGIEPTVLLNEFSNGDASSDANTFVELRNWGDTAVDLTGWHLYRCSLNGLRSNVGRPLARISGIVLEPGEILTLSGVGMPGDVPFVSPLPIEGFGLFLEGPGEQPIDLAGVFPNEPWPMQSECTPAGGNLPNVLDFAQNESWQRIAATGDLARDWVAAPSTLGEQNLTRGLEAADSPVVIAELAGSGPGGSSDDFVELRNEGDEPTDIGGWQLYRCTASGRVRPDTLQLTIPPGTVLTPGERWVAGGPGFTGAADAGYVTSLADVEFGVLVRDAAGALVDRVAVSHFGDSACQGDTKLPAVLDPVAAESYQRVGDRYLIAPRTPGAMNTTRAESVFAEVFAYPQSAGVAISEVATDPAPDGMPTGTEQRNFVELANYGDDAVSIGGWTAWRCDPDGARDAEVHFTVPAGTSLGPGEVFLAARDGTAAAASADLSYDTELSLLGAGVWLADADGERVDSVGIYAANEMDHSNVTPSPCTKGVALTTYQPDRLLRETFQRSRFTGVDADDFVVREATPGVLDLVPWTDPTMRVDLSSTIPAASAVSPASDAEIEGDPVVVVEAWGGATEGGPLTTAAGDDEVRLDPTAAPRVDDDGYAFPYQRLVLDADRLAPGTTVSWAGSTVGRGELQFSVWSDGSWRHLDAATGPEVVLSGELTAADLRDDRVTLLVQNGPRTEPTLASERDGTLEDPAAYDFAISHITDTQYLSESYPEVYAQITSWVADNADARKIEFATHTGDLVQNWVDPDQTEDRARREFATASAIQAILDEAQVPNSVLPGNHDNKRGATNDLFNEYFGPDRYADAPWYGGSLAEGDNSANFSTFEHDGAKFLMLSLPYAYADAEIEWAKEVVAAHQDFNVIVSTHEHVTPKTQYGPAERSTGSRWISRGGDLWREVIAPNRNVVLVLSGHFHGIGELRTDDAGGLPGHDVVELLADYQEFRTHTGERASGFQRLLQIDLASGSIAVDSFSVGLEASSSVDYDYQQFLPDDGSVTSASNVRPWRIVAAGLQDRYTVADDEFVATVAFQYPKLVATSLVTVEPTAAEPEARGLPGDRRSQSTGML
jgi:hypothetical protein